jgi:hypothetical protein
VRIALTAVVADRETGFSAVFKDFSGLEILLLPPVPAPRCRQTESTPAHLPACIEVVVMQTVGTPFIQSFALSKRKKENDNIS